MNIHEFLALIFWLKSRDLLKINVQRFLRILGDVEESFMLGIYAKLLTTAVDRFDHIADSKASSKASTMLDYVT